MQYPLRRRMCEVEKRAKSNAVSLRISNPGHSATAETENIQNQIAWHNRSLNEERRKNKVEVF